MLRGFVAKAVEDNRHFREGSLFFNLLFSVFNVSIVKRVTLVKGEFKVDIDSISKKTHQRNCKFDEVTRFSLSCPTLCDGINKFQKCPESTFLRDTIEMLHDELIDYADDLSEIIDSKTSPMVNS